MQDTPFSRITRSSRRLNLALFGILPVALVLASAMLWGAQRLVKQEETRLYQDFSTLIGNLHAQEEFLHRFQSETSRLKNASPVTEVTLGAPVDALRSGYRIYPGQHAGISIPFSLLCAQSVDCPAADSPLSTMGGFLTDFYSAYWASVHFPAPSVYLVNRTDSVGISVPSLEFKPRYGLPLNQETLLMVMDTLRAELRRLQEAPETVQAKRTPASLGALRSQIKWLRTPPPDNRMLSILWAGLPSDAWKNVNGAATDLYLGTLFNRDRIHFFNPSKTPDPYDAFWLTHREDGLMIGQAPIPLNTDSGLNYTTEGLILKTTDPAGNWTGYYRINYRTFILDHLWLPASALLLLVLSLIGGATYMRWYDRRVIEPAQAAHRDILESEEFNRTLIETAPVALCVLTRATGEVLFGNNLALEWLGASAGNTLRESPAGARLLDRVLHATERGTMETLEANDGRPLFVAYAPTRYKKQSVVLCAFADISARAEIERTLAQAKREADRASEAKSTFLATMSHEIRTPLYGVLGTLELMGLTDLNSEQRQHLERIQSSSVILLQLISDILDITKIESGQLALESTRFSPRELVESCTASYAAMAQQKGLLLFACVDPSVPPWAIGDPSRIRQILANLLSNAIKFTEAGHVIVRLRAEERADAAPLLNLQVVDTGIGIGKDEQKQLFSPFYQIDSASHTVRGAGIGLSICARLARLMHSDIRVTSELGLGSSFLLDLALKPTGGPALETPELQGARIHVRSPNRELSDNVCRWLRQWGAQAQTAAHPLVRGGADEVLIDLLQRNDAAPLDWPGPYLFAGEPGTPSAGAHDAVDGHRMESIGFGVQSLLRGEAAIPFNPVAEPAFLSLGLRVLVAEDNPINQTTLRDQLEQLGCAVTVASDGAEALSLWTMSPFDVLLTDVNMPKMNGYELAGALRERGVTAPIIGVTANAMRDEETRCMAAGMSAWLVKPIELRTLQRHLGGVSPSQPLDRTDHAPEQSEAEPTVPSQGKQEPTIPAKYRSLFLDTMNSDLAKLDQALSDRNVILVLQTLHRMRGALVMVKMDTLSLGFEAVEAQLKRDGRDERAFQEANRLILELRAILVQI